MVIYIEDVYLQGMMFDVLRAAGNLAAHPPVPLLSATCFYGLDRAAFLCFRAGLFAPALGRPGTLWLWPGTRRRLWSVPEIPIRGLEPSNVVTRGPKCRFLTRALTLMGQNPSV